MGYDVVTTGRGSGRAVEEARQCSVLDVSTRIRQLVSGACEAFMPDAVTADLQSARDLVAELA